MAEQRLTPQEEIDSVVAESGEPDVPTAVTDPAGDQDGWQRQERYW